MSKHTLLVLHISNRTRHASRVQEVLTAHGCSIKTRLGLHEAGDACSPDGLIVLEMCGEEASIDSCEKALCDIEGLEVRRITFSQ